MDPANALKYRSVFPYVLMLVVIAIRPQGLFGEDGEPAVTAATNATSTTARPPAMRGYPYLVARLFLGFMVGCASFRSGATTSVFFNLWIIYTIMVVGFYFVFGISGQFAFCRPRSRWSVATRRRRDPSGLDWILAVAFGIFVAGDRVRLRVHRTEGEPVLPRDRDLGIERDHQPRSSRQWNQFTGPVGAEIG